MSASASTPSRSFTPPTRRLWSRIQGFLFPHAAERDEAFRAEIERLSVRSLYIIAGVCLGMPALGFLFHQMANLFEPYAGGQQPWMIFAFLALAVALVAAARTARVRRYARPLALLAGLISAGILTWNQILANPDPEEALIASMIGVVIVMLVGVVSIPALPVQIFALGAAIGWLHFGSAKLAEHWEMIPAVSLHHYAGLDLVTILCTALSAVNYQRLHEAFLSHQRQMAGQSRLLLSESAALMGRFAATLSHELNTPAGALQSALDSMDALTARKAEAPEQERERLEQMAAELRRTARESARGLTDIVRKMQRFTNLDRAEVMEVDLNDLLRDVASMVEPEIQAKVELEMDCRPLPPLMVRPQQISAVFSNLLHNAIQMSPRQGRVSICSRQVDSQVEVTVRDNGRGLSREQLADVFDPGFYVEGGRVRSSNWGLFSSRQIVREHGGEVQVESVLGGGTEVRVLLPRRTNLDPAA